ncbi:cytochrome P450 [Streptomyces sp. BI20]|uniref:cytochrome P450 n=1 Tax=Streptomyces sp. BI20 TaxID=3403460 RepID=UPI003C74CB4B
MTLTPNHLPPVPALRGTPPFGALRELRADALATFARAHALHGDVVRLPVGPPGLRTDLYCVFSPAGVQQVLAADAAAFRKESTFYEEIRHALGNGLLTSQDAEYLRQRRLVQPLFTPRRVDGYAGAIVHEVEGTLAAWAKAPGETVDVGREMTALALRAVTRILFGTDGDAVLGVVRRCFPVITGHVTARAHAPVRLPRSLPTPGNRRAVAAMAELYGACDAIVAERRRAERTGGDAVPGTDLLTLLTEAGDEADEGAGGHEGHEGRAFDAAELRDQVLIFLLAGHETTATSLTFALHLLALHPAAQARARAEVFDVLGPDRPPTAGDLDRLPYLTRVLKESMRLYPAAPAIGRRSVTALTVDGYPVPADVDVVVSPWVTHRDPVLWPDPERFDPDRFTPEAEAARPRYAWFPFGGGPRACVGRHFSMLEAVLALAILLRAHEVEAVDRRVPVSAGITLRAEGPVRCRLTPVSRPAA